MKTKILFLSLIFVLSISSIFAQGKGNKKGQTPEQRATKQSNHLAKKLALSDTQKKQIYDFSLANNQQIDQECAVKEKGDHKKIVQIRQDLQAKIESVLTPDQKVKHQALKQNQANKKKDKKGKKDDDDDNF